MADLTAHHVGITVADLDRAVDFYTETFGLDVAAEFSLSGDAFADAVGVAGATGSFAHLDAGGALVELVEYDPEAEPLADHDVNEPGAIHLGLGVDDLDAVHAELDGDVEAVSEPRTTESGARILFVRDPEGNLVELIEAWVVESVPSFSDRRNRSALDARTPPTLGRPRRRRRERRAVGWTS